MSKNKAAANTGLAKVAVQCSADTFVVNQSLVLRINSVLKIATFAKPETVSGNCKNPPYLMTYIVLVTLNIVLLLFIRNDRKYWVISIPIWAVLLMTFIFWRVHHDNKYKRLESSYWKTAENKPFGDERIIKKMDESKKYVQKYNMTLIHAIALQTILTFIFQIIGYRKTQEKKLYKLTSITFGILTFLTFIFEVMLGIVPTGGIIG